MLSLTVVNFVVFIGRRVQEMEEGSHASEESHFAGIISGLSVETKYCMKLTSTGQETWQPGL